MATALAASETTRTFQEFVRENGPSYLWGEVVAPHDGCFHLNAVAFIRGKFAFVTADLCSFTGGNRGTNYAQYVVKPPKDLPDSEIFSAGCILAEDLDKVLSHIEFKPLSSLAADTPFALTSHAIRMAQGLGYDVSGLFKCALCGQDLSEVIDCEELGGVYFLKSGFHGAGGIAIDVDAPVCGECFLARQCAWCGEEVEPDAKDIDDAGHCVWCAPEIRCQYCGASFRSNREGNAKSAEAYRAGCCPDCLDLVQRGEAELETYRVRKGLNEVLFE